MFFCQSSVELVLFYRTTPISGHVPSSGDRQNKNKKYNTKHLCNIHNTKLPLYTFKFWK